LVIKHFRDVVFRSDVFVNLLGNRVRIRAQEVLSWGSQIVVQRARVGQSWKILEPLLGKGVLQAWIGGTDDVRSAAVATHELVAQEGEVGWTNVLARVVGWIWTRGGRIVDVSTPVTKIALLLR